MTTLSDLTKKYTKNWTSRPKKPSLPWFNSDIWHIMKKRDIARKKSIKTRLHTDHLIYTGLRNQVVSELRKAKINYFTRKIEEANGSSSILWQHINSLINPSKTKYRTLDCLQVDGTIINNNESMANVFNNFFIDSVHELANNFRDSETTLEEIQLTNPGLFKIREVPSDKIKTIITNMCNSKAQDIYNLNMALVKKHQCELLVPITHLVNLSIRTNTFPECWKPAVITPIHKSGEKDTPNNYRPIAILPVVSKVLEKVIAEQLIEHLESNQLLHSQQFGFRQKYSTETANCYLLENIKGPLDKGHVVGAVFLDLKKAFDTVDHSFLLSKLQKMQMSQSALKWFKSYLHSRQQCVKVNGVKSALRSNDMGVPQGSVLGPLLFSIYINDLPDCCLGVNCQLYADDTVIHVSAKTTTLAAQQLTLALVNISEWLELSHLTLNIRKTVAMCFSIKKRPADTTFEVRLGNEMIQEVKETKYLGIILDENLKFQSQVKSLCKKLKSNLNCFRFIRRELSHQAALMYMHAMIFSHLSYCITSWSQTSTSVLQPVISLYKQTIKVFDRKPMRWHHCNVIQKHGLFTFENFINFSILKLVFKCLNSHVSPPFSNLLLRRQASLRPNTRAAVSGNCVTPAFKSQFGRSSFSYHGSQLWNSLPTDLKLQSDLKTFTRGLKKWLKSGQNCAHDSV